MKKILSLVLILALLVATTGCGGAKTAQAYDIYTQANDAMSKIDSLIADTAMTMNMSYGGQDMEIAMDGYIKEIIKSETDVELELSMNTTAMGEEMAVQAFYKDGVYYMQLADQKVQMEMPFDQIMEQANTEALTFPETAIKNQQATPGQGGSQELTFTLDGVALTDTVAAQMGGLTEMFGSEVSMTVGDIDYVVVVDANGNLQSTSMGFSMEMLMMGETIPVSAEISMDFVQIGNVSIEFPADLDTYMPVSM